MGRIIEACCLCDIGRKRKNNEDNFYFDGISLPQSNDGLESILNLTKSSEDGVMFAVFDGMGGECNGEIASYVASELMHLRPENNQSITDFFEEQIQILNEAVCAKREELLCGRMGSTVVECYIKDDNLTLCNLGDSRGYRFRDDQLFQLSMDHNEDLLFENKVSNRKPALTQHLGIMPDEFELVSHVITSELKPFDIYLLCSDGVTDMLSDFEIRRIFREFSGIEVIANKLMENALNNGGIDNTTMILISVK